jgi:hypothetical protein
MFETCITILDDNGVYPKETVFCNDIGFSKFKGIPLLLSVKDQNNKEYYKYHEKPTLFKAAFLITNRDFPVYNFPPSSNKCTIHITKEMKPDLKDILKRVKLILRGIVKPKILYDPVRSDDSYKKRMSKIVSGGVKMS